jgi:hypothetical protein
MDDYESVTQLINRYGDDLYRFAFVLTCSDSGASELLADTFAALYAEDKLTEQIKENRLLVFKALYDRAPKFAGAPDREMIKEHYGEKDAEFYGLLCLPIYEKALKHLVLYEDYTEKEAAEILQKK